MMFGDKLRELRKQKGLTQDELAAHFSYIPREKFTEWEDNRDYPSIHYLELLSRFFSISLNDLISSEILLVISAKEHHQHEMRAKNIVFGLLDCLYILLLVFPIYYYFGLTKPGFYKVLQLSDRGSFLYIPILISVLFGFITLLLRDSQFSFWIRNRNKLSFLFSIVHFLLFLVFFQFYFAIFAFSILLVKCFISCFIH